MTDDVICHFQSKLVQCKLVMEMKPAGCELFEYKVSVDNTVLSTAWMILLVNNVSDLEWFWPPHLMLNEFKVWFLLLKYFTDHLSIHTVPLMHLS